MPPQHLLAAWPKGYTRNNNAQYLLCSCYQYVYYIESKCRFVAGSLCVVDMPSEEVVRGLPLQQAYYLTCCYCSRLTQHTLVTCSYAIPQPRKVLRRTSAMPMLLVVMLFRAIVAGLLLAIIAGLLFSWCAGVWLFKQGHSLAGILVYLIFSVPFGCVDIYPLVVSFSLAIAPSEIRRVIVSFSLEALRGTNTTQFSDGSNQINVDDDIIHCVKCSVLARYRTSDELIE